MSRFDGVTVSAGMGILGVAATDKFFFDTFVYEHDVSYLSPGDNMVCVLRSHPLGEFKSSIHFMMPVDVRFIENVGVTLADVGHIPVKPTADGRREPLVTLYLVRSESLQGSQELSWGLTGKASITYGAGPVGTFYFNRIVRALRLRLQRA